MPDTRPPVATAQHEREVVRAALRRVRLATGLPVLFGGTIGQRGVRLTELLGTLTPHLHGLVIRPGAGLGGRVIVTTRPGSVEDYLADPRITHEYDGPVSAEGLRAIGAVPVVVDGSVAALMYGGTREPVPLGTRVLDAMAQAAARAGTELTVRREVERRMAELETAAVIRAAREAPAAPEWEEIRQAHAELRSIAREITDPALRRRIDEVCARLTRPGGRPARPNPLSPRELDVLALVAVGCGNAEAARRLGIGPETVKSYLRNAMRKLGTHSRMETVVAARRAGFLP